MSTQTIVRVPTILEEFITAGSGSSNKWEDKTITTLRNYQEGLRLIPKDNRIISSDYGPEILQETIQKLNARLLSAHVLQALLRIARGEPGKAQEEIELARALLPLAGLKWDMYKGEEAIALVEHQLSQLLKQSQTPPATTQEQPESTLFPEMGHLE